jgi:polyferredoxin
MAVALIFALPLLFALLFGRVFCAAVCPLGVLQDLVLIKPLRLPQWLSRALGVIPPIVLGLAVLFAVTGTGFIVCRFDPYVVLFRRSGPGFMLILAAVAVGTAVFVGRPYCRFFCPLGVILGALSRWSWFKVSVTPDECVNCSLCEDACPFGAIEPPVPEGARDE